MKKLIGAVLLMGVVGVAGCSSGIAVQSAHDPDYSQFANLKTYRLMTPADDPEFPQWALEHTMYMAGKILTHLKYVEADSALPVDSVDFLVNAHGTKDNFVDTTKYQYGVDKWDWQSGAWDMQKYEWLAAHGSITLDIVDAKTNQLIWRASADSDYKANLSRGQIEQKLEVSVRDMLKLFPPKE